MLDLVPTGRRVSGPGASLVMAPFTHASTDRPSRFSDGSFGVYYAGDSVEVALFETIYHHGQFMAATDEAAGWTSDFRELVGSVDADLHDVIDKSKFPSLYEPEDYSASQALAISLRTGDSDGLVYQSVRYPEGMAIALFWPDVAGIPTQGKHFSYYWDGATVSQIRDLSSGDVFSVVD